jgi:hypothetical protein
MWFTWWSSGLPNMRGEPRERHVCPFQIPTLPSSQGTTIYPSPPFFAGTEKLITNIWSWQGRKPSRPSSSHWPAAPGKEPYEELNPYMVSRPRQDPEPDPLLSQFIYGGGNQTELESRDGASQRRLIVRSSVILDVQRWARWFVLILFQ